MKRLILKLTFCAFKKYKNNLGQLPLSKTEELGVIATAVFLNYSVCKWGGGASATGSRSLLEDKYRNKGGIKHWWIF